MTDSVSRQLLDRFAIGMSLLCLLHCLALPLLLVLVPSLSALGVADERFHQVLVFLVLPTSLVALYLGCRRHRRRSALFWGLTGVTVLVLAAVFGHDVLGEIGERIMTVVGALMVALGHFKNMSPAYR